MRFTVWMSALVLQTDLPWSWVGLSNIWNEKHPLCNQAMLFAVSSSCMTFAKHKWKKKSGRQKHTFMQHVKAKCELYDTRRRLFSSFKVKVLSGWCGLCSQGWGKSIFIALMIWLNDDTQRERQEMMTLLTLFPNDYINSVRGRCLNKTLQFNLGKHLLRILVKA